LSSSSVMVLVVGVCRYVVELFPLVEPPSFAIMNRMRPLYIIPRRPWSFSTSWSCSPMYFRYAFLSEKAFMPNSLCNSCVARFGVLLGTLHIALVMDIIFLSNFFMLCSEYGAT
jgi:hypothetical protein